MQQKFSWFDIVNYIFLALVCFTTFYPFWTQVVISLSTAETYYGDWFHIVPKSFSLESYQACVKDKQVVRSFLNSVIVTTAGTTLSLAMTTMAAYFLSKNYLRGRNVIFFLFVLTYFISGGLIPFYLVVVKLGMRDSLLALFIPSLINVYYIILMKNYFQHLPASLEESAKLDGASDIRILLRIVVPTSKPIMATIGLFVAVQFWNDWFRGLLFLTSNKLYPLSLYLRFFLSAHMSQRMGTEAITASQIPGMLRAAIIMITIVPIILVYPFIQRHFVKGIMLGAVKA